MPYLLVRHRVADFGWWYEIFKSHAEARREAGLEDLQLLRDAADPNIVVCIFGVDDLERGKAFTHTPEADRAKKESGVVGEPEVLFLNEV